MNATITVNTSRATIDPQGIGSDEDAEFIAEIILDAVRAEWPDADVTAVGNGGRTGGRDADGTDISADVQRVVNEAFEAACAAA